MPGVTKEGKSGGGYNYDIGGKTQKSSASNESEETAPHKYPPAGNVGKLDKLNTDRFYERSGNTDGPAATMGKTGYENGGFDKNGYVKNGVKSDVNFIEKDGSWAPANGRGGK